MSLPKDARIWLEQVRLASVPKMENSACYLGLATEQFLKDPICLLQLGAAVALGKPMFLIVTRGTKLTGKMVDVVDGIIEIDHPSEIPQAHEKIQDIMKKKGILK